MILILGEEALTRSVTRRAMRRFANRAEERETMVERLVSVVLCCVTNLSTAPRIRCQLSNRTLLSSIKQKKKIEISIEKKIEIF